ncbi:Uncharacterised protein [Mycobacteroides abscessus]|nr:Uncharacterised protein [Mycobacteroides abscessus]
MPLVGITNRGASSRFSRSARSVANAVAFASCSSVTDASVASGAETNCGPWVASTAAELPKARPW